MKVVPMARYRARPVVDILEALVAKARKGEVTGVALCYRTPDGFEDSVIAGSYAESTDMAAAAAMRLSMRLASARGEYSRSP